MAYSPGIACIANAQPVDGYVKYLRSATLGVEIMELRDGALYVAGHTEKGDAQMARKASNIAE